VSRVRFLPPQSNADFLDLLSLADVMLDPLHFGGGNTSYEALAIGTPLVTLPGNFARSRITRALYQKMEMPDLIAASHDDYVELSLQVANDMAFQQHLRKKLHDRSSILFEDDAEVRDFDQFFLEVLS